MLPSYRNQSVDLLCKSTEWFLYDGKIGRWRVNIRSEIRQRSLNNDVKIDDNFCCILMIPKNMPS